jgi:hypothetical protein
VVAFEYLSSFSSALDFILLLIMAAGVFYGLKVKFVGEAKKEAGMVDKKVFNTENKDSIVNRIANEHDRINELHNRIDSNTNEIGKLMERTRNL